MDAGDAARAAMAQRKDVQPEWVITTFGTLVDGLKAATTSPDTSRIPHRSASSDPGPGKTMGARLINSTALRKTPLAET